MKSVGGKGERGNRTLSRALTRPFLASFTLAKYQYKSALYKQVRSIIMDMSASCCLRCGLGDTTKGEGAMTGTGVVESRLPAMNCCRVCVKSGSKMMKAPLLVPRRQYRDAENTVTQRWSWWNCNTDQCAARGGGEWDPMKKAGERPTRAPTVDGRSQVRTHQHTHTLSRPCRPAHTYTLTYTRRQQYRTLDDSTAHWITAPTHRKTFLHALVGPNNE